MLPKSFKPKSFKPKRVIALLLVALLALAMTGWPGVGWASFTSAIQTLDAQGIESNSEVTQAYIDIADISNGTVSSRVYSGINQDVTTKTFTSIQTQTYTEAHDRLTRFIFELTNRYRPDTELALSGTGTLPTVRAWTYGTMKDEAMWAIINGLPDCLGNPPITSSSGSDSTWVDQYSPDQIADTIATATATFSISSTTLTIADTSTSETKTIEMDVAPELIDGRTFVPVRYLAYAIGVDESGVVWDDNTNTASITKDETSIKMTIGNNLININGKANAMDVTPYIKNGRTMLPARWVAEPLGAKVGWDKKTQQVTLTSEITTEITKQGQ